MPTYVFTNGKRSVERWFRMSKVPDEIVVSGESFKRNLSHELRNHIGVGIQRTSAKPNSLWPKYSRSSGIGSHEVDKKTGGYKDPKKRARFPNHKFDSKGRMEFNSRSDMLRKTKDIGMESQ